MKKQKSKRCDACGWNSEEELRKRGISVRKYIRKLNGIPLTLCISCKKQFTMGKLESHSRNLASFQAAYEIYLRYKNEQPN